MKSLDKFYAGVAASMVLACCFLGYATHKVHHMLAAYRSDRSGDSEKTLVLEVGEVYRVGEDRMEQIVAQTLERFQRGLRKLEEEDARSSAEFRSGLAEFHEEIAALKE